MGCCVRATLATRWYSGVSNGGERWNQRNNLSRQVGGCTNNEWPVLKGLATSLIYVRSWTMTWLCNDEQACCAAVSDLRLHVVFQLWFHFIPPHSYSCLFIQRNQSNASSHSHSTMGNTRCIEEWDKFETSGITKTYKIRITYKLPPSCSTPGHIYTGWNNHCRLVRLHSSRNRQNQYNFRMKWAYYSHTCIPACWIGQRRKRCSSTSCTHDKILEVALHHIDLLLGIHKS